MTPCTVRAWLKHTYSSPWMASVRFALRWLIVGNLLGLITYAILRRL